MTDKLAPYRGPLDQAARDDYVRKGTYETLPDAVRMTHSATEFAWLTDAQRGRLVQDETEPEWNEP